MDSPKTSDEKARVRICPRCEQYLTDAANAMRRHGSQMTTAIYLTKTKTDITEEERQEVRAKLVTSFNEAQAAWNSYREHLIQHGILPVPHI